MLVNHLDDAAAQFRRHAHAEPGAFDHGHTVWPHQPSELLFIALEGAGYAAEEQNKLDVALEHFKKLLTLPNGFYKDYGLKHTGRMYELKEDKPKAIEAYKAIVAIPSSKLHDFAESRLAVLE